MEEVNEGGFSRPDFPNKRFLSRCILDEDIPLETFIIGTACSFDASVDNGDVSVSVCDILHDRKREATLINGEVFVVDHVIDICPDGVQGKVIFLIIGKYVLKPRREGHQLCLRRS